jgi:mono/diheme cytochrome c family protein
MSAMFRVVASLACVLGMALAFAAIASAAEPNLTVTVAGRTTTYAPASLLGMPAASSVTIPNDVAYKRDMSFRAVPAASLLGGVGPDDTLRFVASDGFVATLPAALLLARSGAVAYLAIEPVDAPWPPLKPEGGASAGPFYLVWLNPERARVTPEQWPYQVARIEAVAPLIKRYPMLGPASSAHESVRRGYAVFEKNCSVCHTLNLGGDASVGPDLNVPYNPTEYMRVDALRLLIRNPQSLRRWPAAKMPAFETRLLSDRDLSDLLAYLRHMADRKITVPAGK